LVTGGLAARLQLSARGADATKVTNTSASTAARPRKIESFDFRRQSKFGRDHIRAYEIVQETFARQFGTILSTTLREVSQVNLASVHEATYDEYIHSRPNPCLLVIMSMEPLQGAGILQLPMSLGMAAVDRMLGGSGKSDLPDRALTEIVTGLVQSLVDRLLRELAYAMETLGAPRPAVVRIEQNPQFAQVTAATEQAVITTFEVVTGEGETSEATLYLPAASLTEPLEALIARPAFGDRPQADTAALTALLQDRLLDVPVELAVRFAQVTATSAEVVDLAVGDVLQLGHGVGQPLMVSAGEVPCFVAVPGRKGKRLACQIVDPERFA
jgi:flagellar motor switch protein FliM